MKRVFAATYIIILTLVFFTSTNTASSYAADKKNTNEPGDVHVKKISKALKKVTSSLKSSGVTSVPSASAAISSGSTSGLHTLPVQSGTPPLLPDIPSLEIKNLFWRPGIVDAIANSTANAGQCQDFFSSNIDGHSGGLGACFMAADVGRVFQTILDAEVSLCYMKNLPTKRNLNNGGITLVSGSFPNDNVTKLFAPRKYSRLVKVAVDEIEGRGQKESVFILVPSKSVNSSNENLYRTEIYFCPEGELTPRGYNVIEVNDEGEITISEASLSDPFGGGAHSLTLQGKLTFADREIQWNENRSRRATLSYENGQDKFKSEFEINSDDQIILKNYFTNADIENKVYTISHFSGTDAKTVRFLEGAFKAETSLGMNLKTFSAGTEYRDTLYVAAPNNSLVQDVDAFDISGDSFYSSGPSVSVDTSNYSCTATPDIEIRMEVGNATLEESLSTCFRNRLENMDFCHQDPSVRQAEFNFHTACP